MLHRVCLPRPVLDGHLGCFHLLVFVNRAAMNTGAQVSVRVPAFSSFQCDPGIEGQFILNKTALNCGPSAHLPTPPTQCPRNGSKNLCPQLWQQPGECE